MINLKLLLKSNVLAKYSHSQKILLQKLRNSRYFLIYCEFRSEYQVQLSPQFPSTPANTGQNPTEIRAGQTQIRVSLIVRFLNG